MAIEVRPLSNVFGAEVIGADLARWDDDAQFETIHDAFLRHGVIAIRDQDITPEQHIAFSRRFGTLLIHILAKFHLPGHPELLVLSNRHENDEPVGLANAGHNWHTDISYWERPPLGSLLYALEIPPEGGDTLFADMHAAYDALPDATKLRIGGLEGVYNYTRNYEKARCKNPDRPPLTAAQLAAVPTVKHPVVRIHPETGRKALYVNSAHTTGIAGMAEDEAQSLLQELFAFSTGPDFIYRHQWRRHDVLFWDNRRALHHALPYDPKYERHMHRATVEGDRPV